MKAPSPLELYGALSIWMIVTPERFGRAPLPEREMIKAAERASKELRLMFHGKPLKPWKARREKSGAKIFPFSRRGFPYSENNTEISY